MGPQSTKERGPITRPQARVVRGVVVIVLSLSVSLACGSAWWWSTFTARCGVFITESRLYWALCSDGSFYLRSGPNCDMSECDLSISGHSPPPGARGNWFAWDTAPPDSIDASLELPSPFYAVTTSNWVLAFPIWWVMVPVGAIGVGEAFLFVRRIRRSRADYCSVCGYDLRGTPDRCPECGTAVKGSRE